MATEIKYIAPPYEIDPLDPNRLTTKTLDIEIDVLGGTVGELLATRAFIRRVCNSHNLFIRACKAALVEGRNLDEEQFGSETLGLLNRALAAAQEAGQ